jgi:hypothetical protein
MKGSGDVRSDLLRFRGTASATLTELMPLSYDESQSSTTTT